MIIQTISDTHNKHKVLETNLQECDLIIHGGDFCGRGRKTEALDFLQWYADLPYKNKVLTPGNHDIWVEREGAQEVAKFCDDNGIHLLIDSAVQIDGIKIWGSPVTQRFGHGWAWNRDKTPDKAGARDEREVLGAKYIGDHWDLIPDDADIVVCHQPCQGILDFARDGAFSLHRSVGCPLLRAKMDEVRPKLFICGHIHECGGQFMKLGDTTYANTATTVMQFNWDEL